jgi:NAD dependent epimerase/dehydratase family enzyme
MADELLLASSRIEPRRLEEAGFRFLCPDLEGALRFELGRLDPAATEVELTD